MGATAVLSFARAVEVIIVTRQIAKGKVKTKDDKDESLELLRWALAFRLANSFLIIIKLKSNTGFIYYLEFNEGRINYLDQTKIFHFLCH